MPLMSGRPELRSPSDESVILLDSIVELLPSFCFASIISEEHLSGG